MTLIGALLAYHVIMFIGRFLSYLKYKLSEYIHISGCIKNSSNDSLKFNKPIMAHLFMIIYDH